MDEKERLNKITQILDGEPVRTGETLPIRPDKRFNVYQIPLELLIYNHLNDRFASRRIEYQLEGKILSNTDESSMKQIESFIWESNKSSNEKTLKDIAKNKQQVVGVITRDGRIIDGNRRVTILRKLYFSESNEYNNLQRANYKFFEAIVLPDDIDDSDMMKLETMLQMGEDEKVEYNALEKYLKIDKLYENGISYSEISEMISSIKNAKDTERMHGIFKLMVEYLKYIKADNRFSLIKKFEDHFINLDTVLRYYESGKYITDWFPDKSDIAKLKMVAFDYIRSGHEGKDFRNIMGGPKNQRGIFSNKNVWINFLTKYEKTADISNDDFHKKISRNSSIDIISREKIWKSTIKQSLDKHLYNAKNAIVDYKNIEKPKELIEGALNKLRLINIDLLIDNFNESKDNALYKYITEINEISNKISEKILNDVYKKN